MYFLRQLKRAKVPISDLVHFYCTCIRSVIEYASPVFHHALPAYLSDDLERLQKRALATILGYGVPYKEALATVAMPTLHERRSIACGKLFRTIANDPNHKLYDLLPDFNNGSGRSLRRERVFNFPRCKTNRFSNSFIVISARNFKR